MANNLYPANYEQETINETEDVVDTGPIGYRPGVAFAWNPGDFVRDGRNRIMDASAVDSWQQWCMNCLQTQRYKHLAYSSDFGIDIDAVFAAETREEAESILTREITEALTADPYQRTQYVDSVGFVWTAPDAIQATITVIGIADVTIDITVNITAE